MVSMSRVKTADSSLQEISSYSGRGPGDTVPLEAAVPVKTSPKFRLGASTFCEANSAFPADFIIVLGKCFPKRKILSKVRRYEKNELPRLRWLRVSGVGGEQTMIFVFQLQEFLSAAVLTFRPRS